MANCQEANIVSNLPFYSLPDKEFNALLGSWSQRKNNDFDLYDLFLNPNKSDESDPDLMLINPCSNYYSIDKLKKLFQTTPKSLSIQDILCSLEHMPNILGITETKLNEESCSNINIQNYIFYHTDSNTNAGGAALYIDNKLKSIPRPDIKFEIEKVESCWAQIDAGKNRKGIIIGCIYKHPGCDLNYFSSQLDKIIKTINPNKFDLYICGDININFLKYNEHDETGKYLDMLFDNNLIPIITKPTRITDHSSTLIDHIYTNLSISHVTSGILEVDLSDHLPVFCIIKTEIEKTNKKKKIRDYRKFDKQLFLNDINLINWEESLAPNKCLDDKTWDVISIINKIVDKHAPVTKITQAKQKQLNKPWLTSGIIKSIKKKQKMYHSHLLSKNPHKINEYKKYANILTFIKQKSKKDYYHSQFTKYKNNLKTTWKIIGNLIKRKNKNQMSPTRIIQGGRTFTNQNEIAEMFNNYFVNVGPNLAKKFPDITQNSTQYINFSSPNSFFLNPVTETQVSTLFASLDANKSCMNIPISCIKIASHSLSIPFTRIYNESISTGIFPEAFKISRVTPIFKNGMTTELGNYRPIAIISPFSKILERLIYDQLFIYLEKKNILYDYQFGFRKGHSTEHAILETIENLKTAIDDNKITCGIFLDFSKAFDTINHKILLDKINAYGIRGLTQKWFSSYITDRKQYVKIGDAESSMKTITCGVPQGSTLGPLLFLLYINDLPNCSKKLLFRIFADDTNIFYSSNNINELEKTVNGELKYVLKYCSDNKLTINFKKTNYMLITSPRKKCDITITTCNIERKPKIKYLGVFIDEHLQWDAQIRHIQNKISKNTGIINKLRHFVSIHMLKQLYYALIYPYLNYGIMSWGTACTSRLKKLKTKQNKCLRAIFFARKTESATPYQILEILKLENIYNIKISSIVYKSINKRIEIPNALLDITIKASNVHTYNTRYASKSNLYRPASRTNYGLTRFKVAASKIWEKIPAKIKSLPLISFKKQYKLFLLNNQIEHE